MDVLVERAPVADRPDDIDLVAAPAQRRRELKAVALDPAFLGEVVGLDDPDPHDARTSTSA